MEYKRIHEKALRLARDYLQAEIKLVEILQIVNRKKVFKRMGYTSLYSYCVEALKLPAEQVYRFNGVAKKCDEIPELKSAISDGTLNVSRARRIVSVIKAENQKDWIEKAAILPQRELEKEVAKVNPKELASERTKILTEELAQIACGVDMETLEGLDRLKDLLSQKLKKPCGLREVIQYLTKEAVRRMDPIEKAKRNIHKKIEKQDKKVSSRTKARKALSARSTHQVNLRDRAQCTEILPNGKRCQQRKWLHVHHIRPVSEGGTDEADNLTTLCFGHHQLRHESLAAMPPNSLKRARGALD